MSINLTEYLDRENIISNEKLNDVAFRLKTVLAKTNPDIDTSANSVFGALILAPLTKVIAAAEEATECILSDVDLSNALNGNVCDCDFSEAFIKSLGLDSLIAANTMGVLRMVMNAKSSIWKNTKFATTVKDSSGAPLFTYIEIDQGTSLVFNDEYLFNFIASREGAIRIIDPTSFNSYMYCKDLPEDYWSKNYFPAGILSMGSDGKPLTYFVDIPIAGPAAASVEAGSVPSSDINSELLEDLFISNGIYNIQDIEVYETPTSIVALAKLAQQLYPSSNFSTKGGIASYLRKLYPDLNCISPITQNDFAGRDVQLKVSESDYIKCNTLDIYAKNGLKEIEVEQIIMAGKDFHAFLCRPLRIISATPYFVDGSSITEGNTVTNQYATSPDVPYISSYLYLDPGLVNNSYNISNPIGNENEVNIYNCVNSSFAKFGDIKISELPYGTYYSYLKVKYTYDPYVLAMDNTLNTKYNAPFVSTVNKNFVTCYIDSLEIKYKKQVGTYIDRQKIKSQLLEFINTLSYPAAYSDAYLYDLMLINGAKYVTDIIVSARLRPTAFTDIKSSNHVYYYPFKSYSIDALDASAITSATGFNGVYVPTDTTNVAYYLAESAIKLTEV